MAQTRKKRDYVRSWIQKIFIGTTIGLIVAVVTQDALINIGLFEQLRLTSIDRRFQQRGPLVSDGTELDIVILKISSESFKTAPDPYPFPRHYYARAIRNLNKLGAKVIGIDLIFDTPSYQNPEYDDEFWKALEENRNVVLAGYLRGRERRGQAEMIMIREDENFGNIFFDADSSLGFVQLRKDADGITRRYPIAMLADGGKRLMPSFGTAIINRYDNRKPLSIPQIDGSYFMLGNRKIPRVAEATLINYYGPSGTFTTFDIIDVIDDETFDTLDEIQFGINFDTFYEFVETNPFDNKIVLIGPMYPESQDLHPAPVYPYGQPDFNEMYGVEIHANAIQTLLDENYLIMQSTTTAVVITTLAALFIFIITSLLKSIKSRHHLLLEGGAVMIMLGALITTLKIGDWYFINNNLIIPIVGPITGIILGYFGSAVHQYLTERKQKVMIKSIFSHYVSPSVVNQLVDNPDLLILGGEKKELTVLFSDIEGFTTISETLSPEELVEFLNEYLDAMSAIVIKHKGTLDKYEGDAIMAFWGAPIPQDDHALRTCSAALDMQYKVRELHHRWKELNKPSINIRIGINTGEMVVGNMGGKERFDYTVIGDNVNLGARLESANKIYGTRIMISESTLNNVKNHVIVRELDRVIVKGKTKPVKIFELIGMIDDGVPQEMKEKIDLYHHGLNLFRQKEWEAATNLFTKLVEKYPNDLPAKLYLDRVKSCIEKPPPMEWDGVYSLETK